jgi:hypothetical protein
MVNNQFLPPEALPVIKDTNHEREMKNQYIWEHGYQTANKAQQEKIIQIVWDGRKMIGLSDRGNLFSLEINDGKKWWHNYQEGLKRSYNGESL